MRVEKVSAKDWAPVSAAAHKACFGETWVPSDERIDFALVAVGDNASLLAYVTCREFSSEVLYWQFGGAFPGAKDTTKSFAAYKAFADWTGKHYKAVTTVIENDNIVMLKMALKVGYRITGIKYNEGQVLLQLSLEFK